MSPVSATDRVDLAHFAEIIGGQVPAGLDPAATVDIRRTAIHSGNVVAGAPFFALRGRRDGRAYVGEALEHGAACAVVGQGSDVDRAAEGRGAAADRSIVVDDPLHALQRLAAWRRGKLVAQFVAVVGSVGKTTTKDALVSFLGHDHPVFGSPGSFNSQIGVALSILRCPLQARFAIIEAATTAEGEMGRLRSMIQPDHVILTSFSDRHRGCFRSDAAHAAEILSIADELPPHGWVLTENYSPAVAGALPPSLTPAARRSSTNGGVTWPERRLDTRAQTCVLALPGHGEMTVHSPLVSVADDVALAAVAATLLVGKQPADKQLADTQLADTATPEASGISLPRSYHPSASASKVWRTPGETLVVRAPVVDDAGSWRSFLADAAANTRPGGRCVLVITDDLATVSDATLAQALDPAAGTALHGVWCVSERAQRLPAHLPLRSFATDRDLARAMQAELRRDDVVAIVGPRSLDLEAASPSLLDAMAPNRLYVNDSAIESNVSYLQRALGPSTRIMAVIKGEAYGTEPVTMARLLERAGVDHFAVATADEGVALRRAGIAVPILVLLPSIEELAKAARHNLAVAVQSEGLLDAVLALGAGAPRCHVDVDTGMRRTGFGLPAALVALDRLAASEVAVDGVMTHLASADVPTMDGFTEAQLAEFQAVADHATQLGLDVVTHALNTAGAIRFGARGTSYARIGIGLVGVPPSADCGDVPLEPALSLVSEIVGTRDLKAGDRVGYGGDFVAPGPMRVAVVPLGYHDGILRRFADGGHMVVGGVACPVVGRVNMDSTVIDITATDAQPGSTVVVFGSLDESRNPIQTVAATMGTIPYEVLCRIGPRVQRVFVSF